MLLDAIYLAALALSFAGAARRNVCAWGLIFAAGLSALLTWIEVPYSIAIWLLIDVAAVSGIAAVSIMLDAKVTAKDVAVVLLFLPAWALYPVEAQWAIDITTCICIAQFLLVTPWPWLFAQAAALRARLAGDDRDDFSTVAHV